MNIYHVGITDYVELLDNSHLLHSWETGGGATVHIVEYAGSDFLIITEPISGEAIVIDSNDIEYGGSVHDHARRAIANGTL